MVPQQKEGLGLVCIIMHIIIAQRLSPPKLIVSDGNLWPLPSEVSWRRFIRIKANYIWQLPLISDRWLLMQHDLCDAISVDGVMWV